jgi:hypothetical protein
MHHQQARAMLLAAAVSLAVMAYGFAIVTTPRTGDFLWPWWFAGSAASCLWLAVVIWSRSAYLVSGLIVPLGFAARLAGMAVDLSADRLPDPGRALAVGAGFLLLAMMAATVWVFVLGPVVSYMGQRRRSR